MAWFDADVYTWLDDLRKVTMNKEELFASGLLEMYVLGLTSPDDTRMVEELARNNPDIQQEIDGLHKALENYAAQHAIPPPPGLKRKVLKRVNTLAELEDEQTVAHLGRRNLYFNLALAASIFFFLTSGFLLWQNRSVLGQLTNIQNENYQLSQACEEDRKNFERQKSVIAFLNAPETLPVQLKGSAISPEATALVFWNESNRKVMISPQGMPEAPSGKQFQVWADVEGEMINMGLLEETDTGFQEMEYIAHAESVNITLEPEGGSEHPTVSLLYANAPLGK